MRVSKHFYFLNTHKKHKKHKKHKRRKKHKKHKKAQKAQNAKKRLSSCWMFFMHIKSIKSIKSTKRTKRQTSDFLPLRYFLSPQKCCLFCFCSLICVVVLLGHVKSFRLKNKTALISFILLLKSTTNKVLPVKSLMFCLLCLML